MSEMYAGIDGKARKVTNIYVGINNVARTVKNIYTGINGKAYQSYEKEKEHYLYNYGVTSNLAGSWTTENTYEYPHYSDITLNKPIIGETEIVLRNPRRNAKCPIRTTKTYELSNYSRLEVLYYSPEKWDYNVGVSFCAGVVSKNQELIAEEKIDNNWIEKGIFTIGVDFSYQGDGFVNLEIHNTDTATSEFIIAIYQIKLI